MSVELIMSQGSSAGTTAPIQPGYYLVGRHRECQIRPKSRSVSRRHCLLLHNEDGFGALDLKSTRGTFVNGEPIEPHQWRVLQNGDEIRFGKVSFTVSIDSNAFVANGQDTATESDLAEDASGEVTPPQSWQNADIASFLEEEDRAEYEEKYGVAPEPAPDVEHRIELSESKARSASDTIVGDSFDDDAQPESMDDNEVDKPVEVDAKPKALPPRRQIDPKQYKRPSSNRSISLPKFTLPTGDGNGWKLLGAIALVVIIGGFFVYQVYRFQQRFGFERIWTKRLLLRDYTREACRNPLPM